MYASNRELVTKADAGHTRGREFVWRGGVTSALRLAGCGWSECRGKAGAWQMVGVKGMPMVADMIPSHGRK